ncbi:LysM peptidoglycan-binding domain-containing protein [Persicitalea sp.]|uniref:septal ring lytic transglycosylase RlpA family protein n=1 Tax=Persicitalea sp. TaxID=3100273 RepID=UPI003593B4A5
MKPLLSTILPLLFAFLSTSPSLAETTSDFKNARLDSLGTEVANGKTYILHKVDPGQTLYAVMRRYGVAVNEIRAANEGMADALRAGQVIRVPYTPRKSAKAIAREEKAASKEERKRDDKPAATPAANAPGMHTVEQGQTLYSIAVKYGTLMADIRKWNGMTSDNVILGQDLIVSEKAYSERSPSITPFPTPKPAEKEEPAPIVAEKPKKTIEEPTPAPREATGRRMSESGVAEIIDTGESSSKYLALHRTVPLGTLVQVKNQYNQEEIWVKVVGRIPGTSSNEDIVIKLSARAFEKLSPNSRRFRAEISYISAN